MNAYDIFYWFFDQIDETKMKKIQVEKLLWIVFDHYKDENKSMINKGYQQKSVEFLEMLLPNISNNDLKNFK